MKQIFKKEKIAKFADSNEFEINNLNLIA